MYPKYCQPIDIVARILVRKRNWFHGYPTYNIVGQNKSFGKIIFDFKDTKVEFNIYINNKDEILNSVAMAIENFNEIADEYYERFLDG